MSNKISSANIQTQNRKLTAELNAKNNFSDSHYENEDIREMFQPESFWTEEVSLLETLKSNSSKLEELQGRLSFLLKEVSGLIRR